MIAAESRPVEVEVQPKMVVILQVDLAVAFISMRECKRALLKLRAQRHG